MGYCVAVDGTRLPDSAVREFVLNYDFEVAYITVCKFITKRDLKQIHYKIIKHQSRKQFTLHLAPRGFGKSTVGDVDFCITKILRNPDIRILIGSKTQGQAEAFLMEIRTHFEENQDLIRIFGDLKGNKWTDKEFTVSTRKEIKKEATVTALGASGQVVSKHFDIIIGDDIVGFENARTETQRAKLKEWFYSSLRPTLEPDGEFHILGTRYHPMDLYQDLIDSGNYDVVIQRAINEFNPDKKGHKDFIKYREIDRLAVGQEFSLWEDKFPLDILRDIRAESGSIIFNMQYQNDVELAKGSIFKAEYFKYYERYEIKENDLFVIVKDSSGEIERRKVRVYFGIDLAISQKETADYFVLMVIGIDNAGNIYVLDYVKDRMSFDKQFNTISIYGYDKFPMVEGIGIESVQYQQSMAQELKRNTTLPIYKIYTNKDKVSRAHRRSALFENGQVFIRKEMWDFEEQLLLFPEVEHDDLFDGFDFAVTVREKGSKIRVLDRSTFRI